MCCSLSRASPATPLVAFSAPGPPAASYAACNPVLFLTFWDVWKRPSTDFFGGPKAPVAGLKHKRPTGVNLKKNVNSLIGKWFTTFEGSSAFGRALYRRVLGTGAFSSAPLDSPRLVGQQHAQYCLHIADARIRQVREGVLVNDMQVGGDVVAEPKLPGDTVTPLLGRALQHRVERGIGHGVPGVDAVDKRRHDARADPPVRRQHEGFRVADPKHQRVAGADLQVIVGDRVA